MSDRIEGNVARLVTGDELLINVGSAHGVEIDMVFSVLDPLTRNVHDPVSGKNLGSIDREKASVRVTKVSELMALARLTPPRATGISSAAEILTGKPKSAPLPPGRWPEGVEARDPVVFTGTIWKSSSPRYS